MKVICICSSRLERVLDAAARFHRQSKFVVWEVTDPRLRVTRNIESVLGVCDAHEEKTWRDWARKQHCDVTLVWFNLEG
jgi:hypothetical protein